MIEKILWSAMVIAPLAVLLGGFVTPYFFAVAIVSMVVLVGAFLCMVWTDD